MYKVVGLVVLIIVLAALVILVTGAPPREDRGSRQVDSSAVAVSPPSVDPMAIPLEQPGWVQHYSWATDQGRPRLFIAGVKIARDPEHNNNIGLTIAIKNIGDVMCTMCRLRLDTRTHKQEELSPRSWIFVVPKREPLAPGEYRRRHWWIGESANEEVAEWRLEFDGYLPITSTTTD